MSDDVPTAPTVSVTVEQGRGVFVPPGFEADLVLFEDGPAHGRRFGLPELPDLLGAYYVADEGHVGPDAFTAVSYFAFAEGPDLAGRTPYAVAVVADDGVGPARPADDTYVVRAGATYTLFDLSFLDPGDPDGPSGDLLGPYPTANDAPGTQIVALEDTDLAGASVGPGRQTVISISVPASAAPGARLSFDYLAAGGSDGVGTITLVVAAPPSTYVRGTEGADNLDRSRATDRVQIAGLGGDDTIRGGAGDDALNGGAGNDNVLGGAGDDRITGGAGADRVAGGAGDDRFVFLAGDFGRAAGGGGALDTILDFGGAGASGGDLIEFRGLGAGASLTYLRDVGGNASNQLYRVAYDADGAGPGSLVGFELQVNMAGGATARLAAGDFAFLGA